MGKIKWYKRDPDAALSGYFELSLEERGAYNTILDLLYSRSGDVPDDDRFIAGWLRCDVRVWRRIKNRLIDTGKIKIENGIITNLRATSEILTCLHRLEVASEAGRSYPPKSDPESNNNNNIETTEFERTLELTTTTSTTTSKEEELDKKIKKKRGTRIPPDWKPTKNGILYSTTKENSDAQTLNLIESFKDHWAAASGQKAIKVDWDAAWRTWVRNDIKFNGPPNGRPGGENRPNKNQLAG